MKNNSKDSIPPKYLFALFAVCIIVMVFHLAFSAKRKADAFRNLLSTNIEKYQMQAVELISAGINEHMMSSAKLVSEIDYSTWLPAEKVRKKAKSVTKTGEEISSLINRNPEVEEINIFTPEGKYLSIFTSAPSAQAHDGIEKASRVLIDSVHYQETQWDSAIYYGLGQKQCDSIDYVFIFLRISAFTIAEAINTEKLKPSITNLLSEAQSKSEVYTGYKLPNPLDEAEIKIFDTKNNPFFAYGIHQEIGIDSDINFSIKNTPWKVSVRLSATESQYYKYVSNGWIILIEGLFIVVLLIILLIIRLRSNEQPATRI